MTPRELDQATIDAKLRILRQLVADLEPLRGVTVEELQADRLRAYALERMLTRLPAIPSQPCGTNGSRTR